MPKVSSELEYWKDEIRRGLAARKEYGRSNFWGRWEQYYDCRTTTPTELAVHYTFALARAIVPMVYFHNPAMTIMPRRPDSQESAWVLEALDNWLIQEMAVKPTMKRLPLDWFLYGVGVIKTGYDSEYGTSKYALYVQAQDVADRFGIPFEQLQAMAAENGMVIPVPEAQMTADESLSALGKKGQKIAYNINIKPGMPWVKRVSPWNFVIEPGAERIDEARWCAERFVRRIEDVKQDDTYEHTQTLKASYLEESETHDDQTTIRPSNMGPRNTSTESPTKEEKQGLADFWEIRDAKSTRKFTICLQHDYFLQNEHDVLQVEGLPFVGTVLCPRSNGFWGIPLAEVVHPVQLELNDVRSLQQKYRRGALRRFATQPGSVTAMEKEKFFSEQAEAFFEVDSGGKPIGEAMQVFQGMIPPDLNIWADACRRDMRELTGQGRNQLGEYEQSGRRTATEAGIVQQNAQIRMDESRDMIVDALVSAIRKVNQFVFKFWTRERVIRVTGRDGAQQWKKYTGQELQGEYDYQVNAEDAVPMTRRWRRQEGMTLLQTLGPFVQAGVLSPEALKKVLKHVLNQFEGIGDAVTSDVGSVLPPAQGAQGSAPAARMQNAVPMGMQGMQG